MGLKTLLVSTLLASTVESHREVPVHRPHYKPGPIEAWKPLPHSPPRDPRKVCFVEPGCHHGEDDAPKITKALHKCNNGGTIVLDKTYRISTPMDMTFLNAVDVVITGEIAFNPDLEYWNTHLMTLEYRNLTTIWEWGGNDVNIYGGGTINGNGQAWWDAAAVNGSTPRPMLLVANGMRGGMIADLHLKDPANFFNLIENSSDVLYTNLLMTAHNTTVNFPRNSDGWDTFRSDNVVIQDCIVDNHDDCVAFKANSSNVVIQNMDCNGSHGMSVGSLGEERLEVDIVENVYIYNVSMSNGTEASAVRIKTYPNLNDTNTCYTCGGGGGYVKNITWDKINSINEPYGIEITQCYGMFDQDYCDANPSRVSISDILIKGLHGTSSGEFGDVVGTIQCSPPEGGNCRNIRIEDTVIVPPSGAEGQWICSGLDESLLDIDCIAPDNVDQ